MKDKVLIVGIDSLIGGALAKHLKNGGYEICGTTRRKENLSAEISYLDLSKNVDNWQLPLGITTAVICAAVSRIELCSKDPKTSYAINVTGSFQLFKKLMQAGVEIIYLSTNQVFKAETPFTRPDAPFTAINMYGKQKAELEEKISALKYPKTLIVRLTKVFGKDNPLFEGWIKTLKEGKKITPFSDMVLAPLPLAAVVQILTLCIERQIKGVLQLSCPTEITYAQAAQIGAKEARLDLSLIQPIRTSQANYTEPFPKHTIMDTTRLNKELNITLPNAEWVIKQAFTNPEILEKVLDKNFVNADGRR